MDRRDFLKALGLFASMPFMSKLKFLNREPVKEGIAAVADKGIEFYNAVIQKVIREGKKIKESDRIEGIMRGTENLEEFFGRKKKKDGGIMELTIMQIPDIEVKGVESLFKAR